MLAQEESRRMGHNFVGTEQLLLGLIGERTGLGACMLKACGIELGQARFEVEQIIGRGRGFVAIEIPFTPRAKNVISKASKAAAQLESDHVATEHLLLGLLDDQHGVGCTVLSNMQIDLDTLRTKTILAIAEYSSHPALGQTNAVRAADRQSMKGLKYCSTCYARIDAKTEICSRCLSKDSS